MVLESCYDRYQFSDYFKTDLPEHWVEKRLGYLAKEERAAFVDGPFGSDLKTSDYKDDGVPLIQLNNIRDSKHLMQNMKFVTEDKKQRLIRHLAIPGDVVIAKMADPVARAAAVGNDYSEYVIVADCVKMTANLDLVDLRYLVWAINSDYVRINAELVSTGTTRIRVNLGELKKLKIPYPSYVEQQQIANFLDHETAKIDTLIEKQQQLIKLLKEKRQAVISHAVTKGLNPNASLRDSGVEWLGEVPEHWVITRAKFLFDFVTSGSRGWAEYYSDEGSLFFRITNLTRDTIEPKLESIQNVTPPSGSEGERAKIKKNDLLISITADLGSVCVANDEITGGYVSQHVSLCRPNGNVASSRWLGFYILSDIAKEQFIGSGYGGTKIQLSLEDIRELWVVQPSSQDQIEIAKYIESQLKIFSKLIVCAEEQIKLLQERRIALISAAVSGKKIDIIDWQTPESLHNDKEIHKEEIA